jgi:indole-3-glycerol phosphate synthase
MILDEIMAHKRQELGVRRGAVPLAELKARAADQSPPLEFAPALRAGGVRLIAEVKRASPSRGVLCANFDPVGLAQAYAGNGAAAISVLTDSRFFQGELEYLAAIKSSLCDGESGTPVLRKDFIFDPYQVHESRAYGADALLLIVAVLRDELLAELLDLTHALGMSALVEVHNEEETARALRLRPRIVGINNRDLRDFHVDLATFGRLRSLLPDDVVTVSESGVHGAPDVRRLAHMGADAVLVGEALVTAPDVGAKVEELAKAGRL